MRQATTSPLDSNGLAAFNTLKRELENAALHHIDESLPFVVECDASEIVLSATLNQAGHLVVFITRKLHGSEIHYPAVEEAMAIVETVRKWQHFLVHRHFTFKTDQCSVAFMFDRRKQTKIENKIQAWRLELGSFSYDIEYHTGKDNIAPDSFTRAFSASITVNNLKKIHVGFCHPGVTRMLHSVKSKNLPYSTEQVKKVCEHAEVVPN